ncbi:hypothetical protein CEXT_569951 [Caerostris extrusa]|uniref:Uncharacterized protein n=1 Tax=Caerostris extrusa TaxID=172846 RepID=A0AAV4XJV2_CAEEX|nr:hypothetical protein CEXT_569951 [Caerostris extrusa]
MGEVLEKETWNAFLKLPRNTQSSGSRPGNCQMLGIWLVVVAKSSSSSDPERKSSRSLSEAVRRTLLDTVWVSEESASIEEVLNTLVVKNKN